MSYFRDVIMNAQLEIDLLPDLSKVMWGRGQNMGRFVKKASKFPLTSLETFFNVLFQGCDYERPA